MGKNSTLGAREPATSSERRIRRAQRVWLVWMIVFTGTFLVGGWIFKQAGWAPQGNLAIVLSLVPLIPGVMALRAFIRFVRAADEMIREILIEGLVLGFGAVMVFWGAIQLPEHVWLPTIKASHLMSVLLFGCSFGVVRALWRRK